MLERVTVGKGSPGRQAAKAGRTKSKGGSGLTKARENVKEGQRAGDYHWGKRNLDNSREFQEAES